VVVSLSPGASVIPPASTRDPSGEMRTKLGAPASSACSQSVVPRMSSTITTKRQSVSREVASTGVSSAKSTSLTHSCGAKSTRPPLGSRRCGSRA